MYGRNSTNEDTEDSRLPETTINRNVDELFARADSTIFRCPYDRLSQVSHVRTLMRELTLEVCTLFNTLGTESCDIRLANVQTKAPRLLMACGLLACMPGM